MPTRENFANALLIALGCPQSLNNVDALVAAMAGENTEAAFNPLATTLDWWPDTDYNNAGVKNYADFAAGVSATASTLTENQSGYASILSSLRRSDPPSTTVAAWAASAWGTGQAAVSALETVQADRTAAYNVEIGGSSPTVEATPQAVPEPSPVVTPTPEPAPVALPVSGFIWPTVSIANESTSTPAVKAIQSVLRYVWGYEILVDGYYGPVTEGAVKAFQRSRSITMDGMVGAETYPLLLGI